MKKKTIWDLHRVTIEEYKCLDKTPIVVVVDNVRSLNNIGSLFRTVDGFGLQGIILCGISATPPSPEIHKTALGAEDSVDWAYYESTIQAISYLKEEGYTVCCLEQVEGSTMLQDFRRDPSKKYALVIGNEVEGVDPAVVDLCDIFLEIPQNGTKHSLNVSVSAGIAMWQMLYS